VTRRTSGVPKLVLADGVAAAVAAAPGDVAVPGGGCDESPESDCACFEIVLAPVEVLADRRQDRLACFVYG
jgi:hypothetical protein